MEHSRVAQALKSITISGSVTEIAGYVFSHCSNLESINFKGTIEQWEAIEKAYLWNSNTCYFIIYCADGEITKYGEDAHDTFTVIVLDENGNPIDGTAPKWMNDAISTIATPVRVQFCSILANGELYACCIPVDVGADGKATFEVAMLVDLAEASGTNIVELHILNVKSNGYDKGEGNSLYGRFEITEIPEIIVTLQLAK